MSEWEFHDVNLCLYCSARCHKVILDIDYDINKGKYFDSIIELYDESGTLLAEADDAPTRSGQDGSASNYDAYLELIIDKPGRYYVKVAAFYGKPIRWSRLYPSSDSRKPCG